MSGSCMQLLLLPADGKSRALLSYVSRVWERERRKIQQDLSAHFLFLFRKFLFRPPCASGFVWRAIMPTSEDISWLITTQADRYESEMFRLYFFCAKGCVRHWHRCAPSPELKCSSNSSLLPCYSPFIRCLVVHGIAYWDIVYRYRYIEYLAHCCILQFTDKWTTPPRKKKCKHQHSALQRKNDGAADFASYWSGTFLRVSSHPIPSNYPEPNVDIDITDIEHYEF